MFELTSTIIKHVRAYKYNHITCSRLQLQSYNMFEFTSTIV